MKFLLDESADFILARTLMSLGHDVTSIVHDYPRSVGDEEVLAIAVQEDRILVTNDRDFGELVFRRQLPHAGVILFRLESEPVSVKVSWLQIILDQYAEHLHKFIVVTDRGVRVRQ
jgi:predicted nuclease of predicted toxin-antitoxin system